MEKLNVIGNEIVEEIFIGIAKIARTNLVITWITRLGKAIKYKNVS